MEVETYSAGSRHRQAPGGESKYAYAYGKQQGYEDPCCADNDDQAAVCEFLHGFPISPSHGIVAPFSENAGRVKHGMQKIPLNGKKQRGFHIRRNPGRSSEQGPVEIEKGKTSSLGFKHRNPRPILRRRVFAARPAAVHVKAGRFVVGHEIQGFSKMRLSLPP